MTCLSCKKLGSVTGGYKFTTIFGTWMFGGSVRIISIDLLKQQFFIGMSAGSALIVIPIVVPQRGRCNFCLLFYFHMWCSVSVKINRYIVTSQLCI